MNSFEDAEFGTVTIRRSARSHAVRLSLAPSGELKVTMPPLAPLFLAKRLLNSSRASLRKARQAQPERIVFRDGDQIGKSHSLVARPSSRLSVARSKQFITVDLPAHMTIEHETAQTLIRETAVKILRKEAKSYLPRRLSYLATQHSLHYERVRFSYASTRWGSCSSSGTISLNISLMLLPFELIDYVILHELAHTRHMNHSTSFWALVETLDPHYKQHRKQLKTHTSQL